MHFSVMSDFKYTTADELYFITLTIVDWINLFDRVDYKMIVVENLNYCIENEDLEVFEYVIMSNHIHLICRRKEKDLNELLGRFKSYTAKEFLKEINSNPNESRRYWLINLFKKAARKNQQYRNHHIWQYKNYPTVLYSEKVIQQKIDYIHQNPVKAQIVANCEDYVFSSAHPFQVVRLTKW